MARKGTARVAVYARVSKADKDDPNSIPVQLADCRDRAEDEGWTIVREYVDEGISAWNPRRRRPEYEHVLADVAAGLVDTILVREQERLLRQAREGLRVSDLAEAGQLRMIACTLEGDINFGRARDRKDFRDRASSAQFYSDFLSEKIRRTMARKRENGEWKGGGTRSFGYSVVGPKPFHNEIIESEAALIRRAAEEVLNGRPVRSITREWNKAGIKTATGKAWEGRGLRDLLRSAHIAGLRDDGGPAGYPAIISPEQSADLVTLLNDPERQKYAASRVRRHFLVGTIRCALCGTKMTAHPNYHGTRTYLCRKGYDGTGCGRTRIVAEPVEEFVGTRLYNRWTLEPEQHEDLPRPEDTSAVEELHELEEHLDELARDYYSPASREEALSRSEYLAAKRDLLAKVESIRGRVSETVSRRSGGWTHLYQQIVAAPKTWAEYIGNPEAVEWHAELAHKYLDRVNIFPATKRGPLFEPDRVEIIWKQS